MNDEEFQELSKIMKKSVLIHCEDEYIKFIKHHIWEGYVLSFLGLIIFLLMVFSMFMNINRGSYGLAFLNMALAGVNGVSCMKMFKGTNDIRVKYKSLLKK